MRHERQVGNAQRPFRVRNRLKRDATRPRLSVFRSHQNFYVQIIDDAPAGRWSSASTLDKRACASELRYGGNKIGRRRRGQGDRRSGRWRPASRRSCSTAASTSITVAWPRLADAAREAGLVF